MEWCVTVLVGMPYLDVVHRLHTHHHQPVAVYQVSGEYSMIKAAAEKVRDCMS